MQNLKEKLLPFDDLNIDFDREWKKTLLCKISFGKIKPSQSWKNQLIRIKRKNFKDYMY